MNLLKEDKINIHKRISACPSYPVCYGIHYKQIRRHIRSGLSGGIYMFSFFSTRTHRKEQVAVRVVVCLGALLFLLCACLSALPSSERIAAFLENRGLAGYELQNDNPLASAHEEALKQFTDRPFEQQTKTPSKTTVSEAPLTPDKIPL